AALFAVLPGITIVRSAGKGVRRSTVVATAAMTASFIIPIGSPVGRPRPGATAVADASRVPRLPPVPAPASAPPPVATNEAPAISSRPPIVAASTAREAAGPHRQAAPGPSGP